MGLTACVPQSLTSGWQRLPPNDLPSCNGPSSSDSYGAVSGHTPPRDVGDMRPRHRRRANVETSSI